jgi:uncharacterized protein YchJ
VKIKLVGGPMNGDTHEVEDDVERWHWGVKGMPMFTYEWTNSKEGDHRLFALASRSRPVKRAIRWFIEKFASHPALSPKVKPYVKRPERGRNEPCRCGSGVKTKKCRHVA